MISLTQFYIDGRWVNATDCPTRPIVNPATEEVIGNVALGAAVHVDRAVEAAVAAFERFSRTTRAERLALLDRIIAEYGRRADDLARAISAEMGAPAWLAQHGQVPIGGAHLQVARAVLADFAFEEEQDGFILRREPVGVCAFITPWNWPLNQIACKVAPAIASGCTIILKPSELAPFSATIFAEIIDAAGVPAGVFNLVHGDGAGVGAALSAHPGVDMVSFTGSTRAGVEVARSAAATVKRVHQELGGKSANILLPGTDLQAALAHQFGTLFTNSGQSCNAPTRLLVAQADLPQVRELVKQIVPGFGPEGERPMGPVVSQTQWSAIQRLIQTAIDEGSELLIGGPGKPEGHERGYHVKPTVFLCRSNADSIARHEVFGPVLAIIPYRDEEDAIRIANDTPYGLAAYVSGEASAAKRVADLLRAGQVIVNGAGPNPRAPFGGYKQSGNGREWGAHAFHDFQEIKAIVRD